MENSDKIKYLNVLVQLIKETKISNFIAKFENKEEIIDFNKIKFLNIENFLDKEIIISNKNIKKLEKLKMYDVVEFFKNYSENNKEKKMFSIKLKNGVSFDFDISIHSQEQFLKRLFYFYHEFKEDINNNLRSYISEIRKKSENVKIDKDFLSDKNYIMNIMFELIKKAETFNEKTLYRKRDILHLKIKQKSYESTNRLFLHPFVFVFSNKNLVTVELYSSSLKVANINKKAKENSINLNYLIENINII